MNQTYAVVCVVCGEDRWPYLLEKPEQYTCARCLSGSGAAKRESGRKGAIAKAARRQQEAGPK